MKNNQLLNQTNLDLEEYALGNSNKFNLAKPFPHIHIENFFSNDVLSKVLEEFPDLSHGKPFVKTKNFQVGKFYTGDETYFGPQTLTLFHYLNSQPWLTFLQNITGIKEKLFGDPYYWGGGLHQTNNGGWLKIHSDFKKHPNSNLDRRVNILIFLNKEWKKSFGGSLEMWDKKMKNCEKKILPDFNTMVIFKTTDYSNHGHPEPIICPENISRKSIALYYYTNGRPDNEINYKVIQNADKTYWKPRYRNVTDKSDFNIKFSLYHIIVEFIRMLIPQTIFSIFFKRNKK